jgi:hypothetical protein
VNRLATTLAGLATVVVLSSPLPAAAQAGGVRGGVAVDPDQFYVGGHYETGPLVDRLHFKPNIEAGFGDHLTLIALNFEFVYKFPSRGPWNIYAGGGPAINIFSFDDIDDSETEPGVNFLLGAESRRGLFFEMKIGAIDSPDLKFGVGWTFR